MKYALYQICETDDDHRYVELVAVFKWEKDAPKAKPDHFVINLETGEVLV
jgi:hypothetical protein